jgi:hypothetical protein
MAFMQRQVDFFAAWQVETTEGTEIVPASVTNTYNELANYCVGMPTEDRKRVKGWFCRLSAPGYMDCTEWSGPYNTEQEADDALTEMYGDDDTESVDTYC